MADALTIHFNNIHYRDAAKLAGVVLLTSRSRVEGGTIQYGYIPGVVTLHRHDHGIEFESQ